ncbi:C39 family peptidase [Clostridium algidicarnis]|uniref:C39 family peptidase n=1 Tax=Clostridium algidicarnis TaxID=37659 RepID=UPI003393FA20
MTLYGEVEYGVYLKGALHNYSYNPNGICGSTAAAMFLRYWDTWHNGNYVPSNLQTSNGEALIKRLVQYIDGSSPDELKDGIQSYLRSQGVNDYMYSETYCNYRVQERIDNNKPFILGLTNHPTYNEHWVTAYGYFVELGRFKYIIVNNGWGGSGVYINSSYCDYIVY